MEKEIKDAIDACPPWLQRRISIQARNLLMLHRVGNADVSAKTALTLLTSMGLLVSKIIFDQAKADYEDAERLHKRNVERLEGAGGILPSDFWVCEKDVKLNGVHQIPLLADPEMPAGEAEFRDRGGKVVGRIVNIGAGVCECDPPSDNVDVKGTCMHCAKPLSNDPGVGCGGV
ncbi:MAG: hypothetical protein WC130_04965 [Kiritimatiellia bacterium]